MDTIINRIAYEGSFLGDRKQVKFFSQILDIGHGLLYLRHHTQL